MENLYDILSNLLKFDTQNNDEIKGNVLRGETMGLLEYAQGRISKLPRVITKIQEYTINIGDIVLGNRGNLVARLEDPKDMPRVMLQGHTDTVPFGKHEYPFGKRAGNVIYGRGAIDMKGPVAAMISTFEIVSAMPTRKYSPVLVLTSDEEARNFGGITHFMRDNDINIEFGICGESSNFKLYNRFKGAVHSIVELHGKSSHGSKPFQGHNAIYDACKTVDLLNEFSFFAFNNLTNPEFVTSDDYSHRSTLNVGKVMGGDKVNSVPDFCRIDFEMRLVHPREFYEPKLREHVLSKIPGQFNYYSAKFPNNDPIVIEREYSLMAELESSIMKKRGSFEYGVMTGFSEASFTNPNGIRTVIFGPPNENLVHTENEQVNLSDLKTYEEILVSFFRKE